MKSITVIFIYSLLFTFFQYQFAYSECMEGDCINGFGKGTLSNGNTYEGDWKKGLRHGHGIDTNNKNNIEFKAFFFNDNPIGKTTVKGRFLEDHIWYSIPNERSGDRVVINRNKNQEVKRVLHQDQSMQKLNGEDVILNEWSFFIRFDEQGNKSRFFPKAEWIKHSEQSSEVKEYDFYNFYVNQIDYFNINRDQRSKDADLFYMNLSEYILMMIEGKKEVRGYDSNKERNFDRKLSQKEYSCLDNFMKSYDMQCDFYVGNFFKPILSNSIPFMFPENQLQNDINESVFLRSYTEDWLFENVDVNKDQFVDVNEIYAIISNPDKNFWYHIGGYQVLPGFEYFLLYDHIHSSSYTKRLTEKKWNLELLKAIPYNKDSILLYRNGSTWNEDFKKFDWNNDDKVTKDEFLKYYNFRYINNKSGPLLPYSLIDENYDEQQLENNLVEIDKKIKDQKLENEKELNEPKLKLCEMQNEMMKGQDITLWLHKFKGCGVIEKCTSANAMLIEQYMMCNSGNNASCQVINSNLPKLKYNCQNAIDSPLLK